MWIQNRIKITISVILIMTCIFSLTSCVLRRTPVGRFEKEKPEYDYLVIEFSETSYAWVDCNNVDWYGEWTFEQKTIPIIFWFHSSSNRMFVRLIEGDLEAGEIYQYENPKEIIEGVHSELFLLLYHRKNDRQNKIATCSVAEVCGELQDGMILSKDQEIFLKKATSEEWQQWMKEHSLDPNLYMQQDNRAVGVD